MKAFSILQPHCSLCAIGEKPVETRSWATEYRGTVALHASARYTAEQRVLAALSPIRPALARHGLPPDTLPTGAIIGTAELVACFKFTWEADYAGDGWRYSLTANDYAFGDCTPGRYGWLLRNVCQLAEPLPARGRLGLWDWEPPAEGLVYL